MEASAGKIVLYDGVCNLCDGAVRFILPRDSRGTFRFASLQGAFATSLMMRHGIAISPTPESILLVSDGRVYQESEAILRIAQGLDFPWPGLGIFLFVPRPIRDGIYRWVARNRYRWFGRAESCLLPQVEWRSRFLEWPVDERPPTR